jgi:hypothetical protein
MKLKEMKIKELLAFFVVIFGMSTIVFVDLKDIVLGALIGFIGAILQYFFGSSTGSAAKDKMIQDMNTTGLGGGNVPPSKDEK